MYRMIENYFSHRHKTKRGRAFVSKFVPSLFTQKYSARMESQFSRSNNNFHEGRVYLDTR